MLRGRFCNVGVYESVALSYDGELFKNVTSADEP